jgi:pimeloyl-ACP methyl ester carboxylesterase
VVALDLRGFGESDKPQEVEQYAMTEIAHDISETITYLGKFWIQLLAQLFIL